jgi:F-type H+-transporting ATPase subunit delta
MAELATIARPYAEALFKAAGAGNAAALSTEIGALAAVAADPQLKALADNPKVTGGQVFDLVSSVVRTPLSKAAQNFLRLAIDNGRVAALPEIARQFHDLVNVQTGVADARIESAYEIPAAQLPDVIAALEKRFGRKLSPSVELKPELIGGIRVTVGDEVLDTSVKARLEQMKSALSA